MWHQNLKVSKNLCTDGDSSALHRVMWWIVNIEILINVALKSFLSLPPQGISCIWSVNCLSVGWLIPKLICRYCSETRAGKILAAAQLVYDVNNPRPSLKTWRHIRNKEVTSQRVDPSRRTCWWLAPSGESVGNAERGVDAVGGSRWEEESRLTVWLIVKKSSGRKRMNPINVMFTEFERMWRIWTAAETPGETQTDMFVWAQGDRGGGSGVIHHKPGTYCSLTVQKPTTPLQDEMPFFWGEWYLRQNVMTWNQTRSLKGHET